VWGWFKRKPVPKEPTRHRQLLGEVYCSSGTLLIGDPTAIYGVVRIENVPLGPVPVHGGLFRYPEGGVRVAIVRLEFRGGEADTQCTFGEFGVDSGKAVILDERTLTEYWNELGPDRIGITCSPKHEVVAELIGRKFGLRHRPVNEIRSEFRDPISVDREAKIMAFLKTVPEYATFPFLYFRIHTNNTVDRINQEMDGKLWCQVAVGPNQRDCAVVMTAGFGDGSYSVVGHFHGDEFLAVEVRFIGPEQDALLKAFPNLRT
jgi:rhodanese-related sulfurtransferase